MLLSEEGIWVTIWFEPEKGYTLNIPLHIPHEDVLLIHLVVIHGGVISHVDTLIDMKKC